MNDKTRTLVNALTEQKRIMEAKVKYLDEEIDRLISN